MSTPEHPLECIAFMLIQQDRVLLERRSLAKRLLPGALAIPGGHLEPGERPEDALLRELDEEAGIRPRAVRYVCTLLHRAQEFRKLHYFAIDGWDGEIVPQEADALQWVRLDDMGAFDLDVDRVAVGEYLRVCRAEAGARSTDEGGAASCVEVVDGDEADALRLGRRDQARVERPAE